MSSALFKSWSMRAYKHQSTQMWMQSALYEFYLQHWQEEVFKQSLLVQFHMYGHNRQFRHVFIQLFMCWELLWNLLWKTSGCLCKWNLFKQWSMQEQELACHLWMLSDVFGRKLSNWIKRDESNKSHSKIHLNFGRFDNLRFLFSLYFGRHLQPL